MGAGLCLCVCVCVCVCVQVYASEWVCLFLRVGVGVSRRREKEREGGVEMPRTLVGPSQLEFEAIVIKVYAKHCSTTTKKQLVSPFEMFDFSYLKVVTEKKKTKEPFVFTLIINKLRIIIPK
jgi:hypothetical protein